MMSVTSYSPPASGRMLWGGVILKMSYSDPALQVFEAEVCQILSAFAVKIIRSHSAAAVAVG